MAAGFRAAGSTSGERQGVTAALEPFAQDLLLAQRATEGDARAQKQLAQRLIVRIRRAAQALMGGSAEADDAAQHALIEILRSTRGYGAETSLESWADRLAARSLVRFARAVRARSAQGSEGASTPPAAENDRPERSARSLEEFLRRLPSAPREALLLRESLGFDLVDTAQLMRSSVRAVREQLARARHGLYLRTQREVAEPPELLPERVERWFTLRDRDASSAPQDPAESEELSALAGDPELRKLQKELRSLAQFLDSGRFGRLTSRDRKQIDSALSAVRVSSIATSDVAAAVAGARERLLEPDNTSWVHPLAMSLCVLLVLAAVVALVLRRPSSSVDQPVTSPSPSTVVRPTVEALSTAQSVDRGAHLQRAGSALIEGAMIREGDAISARLRPGCFVLSPRADVCLAAGAEARVAELGLAARRVELVRGRAVASVERVGDGVPFAIAVEQLHVDVTDATFGVEIEADRVVVRVLRGSAQLSVDGVLHGLSTAQSGIYRPSLHSFEIVPQLIEKARRDWDLLATRAAAGQSAERPALARSEGSATVSEEHDGGSADAAEPLDMAGFAEASLAAPEASTAEPTAPAPEPVALRSADQLLSEAKALARSQRPAEADALYLALAAHPLGGRAAREALVLRGELLVEQLGRPADALITFDRYLATGGGMLEARARHGRIVALRQLGRSADEQAATKNFLNQFGGSPQAKLLRARAQAADAGR